MAQVLSNYHRVEKPVGEGTYGVVYKAKCAKTGDYVALKKIRIEDDDEGILSTTLREIDVLQHMKHRNIIGLRDVEYQMTPPRLYLVFDWGDRDLKKYMDENKPALSPLCIQEIMYQLLLGIEFCHQRGVIHRDLKPQNVLIDKEDKVKIADFGLARHFEIPFRTYTHEVVTLWYRAPEVMLGMKQYSLPIDTWSIGTIFAELARHSPLWPGDCEIDELFRIFRTLGTPNEESWPGYTSLPDYNPNFPDWERPGKHLEEAKKALAKACPKLAPEGVSLLTGLLRLDPGERITCQESLVHDYFRFPLSDKSS